MTYVMSDLHGQYEKYKEMLARIHFSDRDELFVLGDVLDRGPQPISLLWDMSMRANVYPLLGNHDAMAARVLQRLWVEITEENCEEHLSAKDLSLLSAWLSDGGDTTLAEFRKLPNSHKEGVLDYLLEFAPYEEVTVGENRFVLVHGGLPDFSPEKPLSAYDPAEMITARTDYSKEFYKDRYLVTGHTPTCLWSSAYRGRILRLGRHIAIDCGAGSDLPLGCIRLDDFAEFYVE